VLEEVERGEHPPGVVLVGRLGRREAGPVDGVVEPVVEVLLDAVDALGQRGRVEVDRMRRERREVGDEHAQEVVATGLHGGDPVAEDARLALEGARAARRVASAR
jgi:hypothetical protein